MIPNIFVSSTIYDLQYLRDAIRETIIELGYNPVMSDYGDIGYLPSKSAQESCYATIRDCQLAVLIIGKRYGEKTENGLSVTHNEFLTIQKRNVPILTIVDQEVISFKRVYEANRATENATKFPGMDSAPDTFNFIRSVMDSSLNNGIITFTTASDARRNLKSQLAHLFYDLLINQFNPLNVNIQDILSEVKTLRHELFKDKGEQPLIYLNAMKWLIDDRSRSNNYTELAKSIHGSIDLAVPIMLKSSSFEEFISKSNCKITVNEDIPNLDKLHESDTKFYCKLITIYPYGTHESEGIGHVTIIGGNQIFMNTEAKEYFDYLHQEFMQALKKKI